MFFYCYKVCIFENEKDIYYDFVVPCGIWIIHRSLVLDEEPRPDPETRDDQTGDLSGDDLQEQMTDK